MSPVVPHCDVHKTHVPRPLLFEQHHIQPAAMGGPSTADNLVWICCQGHYNTHTLLADLIRTGELPRLGSVTERALAQRGYDQWIAAGRPGTPVYE